MLEIGDRPGVVTRLRPPSWVPAATVTPAAVPPSWRKPAAGDGSPERRQGAVVGGGAGCFPAVVCVVHIDDTHSSQQCRNETIQGNANPAYNGRREAEGGCLGELEMNAVDTCRRGRDLGRR